MTNRLNANSKNFQKDLIKKMNKRSVFSDKDYNVAKKIVLDVKKNGDKAVLKYESKFNKNKKLKTQMLIKKIILVECFIKSCISFMFFFSYISAILGAITIFTDISAKVVTIANFTETE